MDKSPMDIRCPKCNRKRGEFERGKVTFVCCGLRITVEDQSRKAA